MEDVHSEFCPSLWTFFILQIKEQPGKMRNSGGNLRNAYIIRHENGFIRNIFSEETKEKMDWKKEITAWNQGEGEEVRNVVLPE